MTLLSGQATDPVVDTVLNSEAGCLDTAHRALRDAAKTEFQENGSSGRHHRICLIVDAVTEVERDLANEAGRDS